MALIKYKNLRFKDGMQFGGQVYTGIDSEKNQCDIIFGLIPNHYVIKMKSGKFTVHESNASVGTPDGDSLNAFLGTGKPTETKTKKAHPATNELP